MFQHSWLIIFVNSWPYLSILNSDVLGRKSISTAPMFLDPKLKMQFKVIVSVLLFFVAQTMATPHPQVTPPTRTFCSSTLPFMVCIKGKNLIIFFSPILQAI